MRRAFRLVAGLLLLFSAALALGANESREGSPSVLDQLDVHEERLSEINRRIRKLRQERQRLDAELNEAGRIERKSADQSKRHESLVAYRLRETYKLIQASRWEYLIASKDFSDFVLRREYLLRLLDQDRGILRNYNGSLREARFKREDLERKRQEMDRLMASLAGEERALAEGNEDRRAFIQRVQVSDNLKAQAEKELFEAKQNLARKVASLQSSKVSKGRGLNEGKGHWPCPVTGGIEVAFGEIQDGRGKTFHGGWDIRAAYGAPIKSPTSGRVVFSGRFRGFGNLLVLDHGNGYHSLYGHLQEALMAEGREVQAGEILGNVGDTGSLKGPFLYFELRHRGKPVDPAGWFACQ